MTLHDTHVHSGAADGPAVATRARRLWRGGLVETMAALRYRDPAAYDEWLELRDTTMIAMTLQRLNDRQLALIGLCRDTLVLDIDDLKEMARRNREIADEALGIVESTDRATGESEPQSRYAAE